ncbi:MAG: glucosaminidase domain-containing protein [Synechococcales bacterium]|nr:glucosaminidase domain-containing protein [Synechococcales bacterium]
MGRIFITSGHGELAEGQVGYGLTSGGGLRDMILLRDLIVTELRSRGIEIIGVPDDLSQQQSILWINDRARPHDVAFAIQSDGSHSLRSQGTIIYTIGNNTIRLSQGELLLLALLRRVPQLNSQGVKPDTESIMGRIPFCRELVIPSLLMEVFDHRHSDHRALFQSQRREFALGIADGLSPWIRDMESEMTNPDLSPISFPSVPISINGQPYSEPGILINGNAYIPVDLIDRLGIQSTNLGAIRRVNHRGVVYTKAIELWSSPITIHWDSVQRRIHVHSIRRICPESFDRIMGCGHASEEQLMTFLRNHNELVKDDFWQLPGFYREEAVIEGVNHDLAFCQMCLETNFLHSSYSIQPIQNNFAGLGIRGDNEEGISFPSPRLGIRAHIQHLKAYASTEPLVQELVDPRFGFICRGIAPLVHQLSGRWNADLHYGEKIRVLMRNLYNGMEFV